MVLFLTCFLLGSIPFGPIVARIFKVKDLKEKGSGNTGASNVSRVIGFWPAGFLTFALDATKGAIAVFLGTPLGFQVISSLWGSNEGGDFSLLARWAAGFFAVLGHCYSPWLHFKGGKGVATGVGVIAVLSPVSALTGFVAFVSTFIFSGIASLSSLSGLIVASVTYLVLNSVGAHVCAGAAIIALILIRHEANIDALLENREKPIKA